MSGRIAAAVQLAERAAEALSLPVFWRRSPKAGGLPGRLGPDDYDSLRNIVGFFLSVRGQRAWVSGRELVVEAEDGELRFDLAPLMAACRRMPRSAWPDAVAIFLNERLGGGVPEAEPRSAAGVAPPPPPKPVVEPAEGPEAGLGAWLDAAVAFLVPRLRGLAVLLWALLGRAAVLFVALLRRTAVLLMALAGRLAAGVKARLRGPALAPVGKAAREPLAAAPAVPAEDLRAFGALVVECFRRHGYPEAKVERDVVLARDTAGHRLRVQAPGLGRVPCEVRREWWARWVDGVLGERLRALRGRQALAGRSFADVRGLLALQLYGDQWLSDEVFAEAVFSRDLPGLMSALVCRLPEGTFRLSAATVKAWKVDVQDVAEAALTNLRRLRPPMRRVLVAPGAEGMRFQGDGDFAAAQAVLLRENRECAHGYGALVAMPRRSILLVCPLRPMAGAPAVYTAGAVGLITRVLESEREGLPSLSRRLYWYRNGVFVDLPHAGRLEDGRPVVEFAPPPELEQALAAIGRG